MLEIINLKINISKFLKNAYPYGTYKCMSGGWAGGGGRREGEEALLLYSSDYEKSASINRMIIVKDNE